MADFRVLHSPCAAVEEIESAIKARTGHLCGNAVPHQDRNDTV